MSSRACRMTSRLPSILPSVDDSLIVSMMIYFPKYGYAGIYHSQTLPTAMKSMAIHYLMPSAWRTT
jgi:hypothetical protein